VPAYTREKLVITKGKETPRRANFNKANKSCLDGLVIDLEYAKRKILGIKCTNLSTYPKNVTPAILAQKLIVAVIPSDILVNGGAGLAARFLKSTAHIKDPKARISEINRLMIAHYQGIVARNPY
jgi:hypothetical protein